MRDLTFRTPTPDDSAAIVEFQTRAWRESYARVLPQDYLDGDGVVGRQERWAQRVLAGDRELLLAERGDTILGLVTWGHGAWLDVSGLELKSMYLADAAKGTGLADELMARSIGDAWAWLWVYAGNPRAHAFYARHGFAPTGITETDPRTGVDVLLMAR